MGLPVTSDKGGQASDQELQCHNGFAPSPASPCSLHPVTQPSLTPHPSPVCLLSAARGRVQAPQGGISSASLSVHEDERFALTCREMQMDWC